MVLLELECCIPGIAVISNDPEQSAELDEDEASRRRRQTAARARERNSGALGRPRRRQLNRLGSGVRSSKAVTADCAGQVDSTGDRWLTVVDRLRS